MNLTYVKRLTEDLKVCGLSMGDVLHVLKRGFVLEEPERSTRRGFFKYQIEATTPNSEGRTITLVVIPDGSCELNIKRLLWRDEK